uniref:Uncharacterized protein n=2 Tax=Quercus lobata TaxID=97700 RepID=A0A7N2N3B2_QUELO
MLRLERGGEQRIRERLRRFSWRLETRERRRAETREKGFKVMNWIQRKIYLYNVTFGLYMLDWWERYLFNTLVIVLMWFVLYNGSRYVTEFCKRWGWHIEPDWQNSVAGIRGS